MKALILANNLGGLMSFRKEILYALQENGFDVVVSAPHLEKREVELSETGCRFIPTEIDRRGINPVTDMGLIVRYIKMLKTERPDVVLSYTIKPNLYGGLACQFKSIPQLVNITGLGTAVENPGALQKFLIMLYKICLRKCKVMFFQNEANMQFCKDHKICNGKLQLIPGSGVNLTRFQPAPMPEGDVVKFIFVGRVMKQKGAGLYLDMAERIKSEFPNTEFHIVGPCQDGEYEERVKQMNDDGRLIYHGVTTDVRPYLHAVHCTVHPTYYPEGMSNVLLESCASGRAIITTNRPGCREIVENGKNGFVCEEQSLDDLCAKVRQYLRLSDEERTAMGKAGREKVEREFDRQIVIDAYIKELTK